MKSLYLIEQGYHDVLTELDDIMNNEDATTEDLELVNSKLEINEQELKEKSLAYCQYLKNIDNDVDFIDKEIERLKKLKKSKECLSEKLKTNMLNAFKTFNINKLDLVTFKVSIRESQSVNVDELINHWDNYVSSKLEDIKNFIMTGNNDYDESISKLLNFQIKIMPDKKLIKEEISKSNENNAFSCTLNKKQNITIK